MFEQNGLSVLAESANELSTAVGQVMLGIFSGTAKAEQV
jgi:hypothetical protein